MKLDLLTICLIALAVLVTLQLNSCFSKVQKPESMIRNEERIKYLEQERLQDSAALVQKLAVIDSLIGFSQQRFQELENKKEPIRYAIKNIPVIVSSYDKEQLRNASSDYFKKYGH